MDFISYKLLKLLKSIVSKNDANEADMLRDEDDSKTPEQYCQEIQKQFQKIAEDKVKQFEYFIFGALSAYKNQHYHHAYSFIS